MSNVLVDKAVMGRIANAIRSKRGVTTKFKPASMPDEIMKIEGGGGEGPDPTLPIRFYDYDGTLLYSYSLSQLAGMTELPEQPVHDGLVADGWNWTLEKLKEYAMETNVASMYMTDNEATRFYIHINETLLQVGIAYNQTVAHGIKVDWGDGSPLDSGENVGDNHLTSVLLTHTYEEPGDYVISFIPDEGAGLKLYRGGQDTGSGLFSTSETDGGVYSAPWRNAVTKIELGRVQYVGAYTLAHFISLESISVPNSFPAYGGNGPLGTARRLKFFPFPRNPVGVYDNYVPDYFFREMYNLEEVSLPDTISSLGYYAFSDCFNLKRILVPRKVNRTYGYMFGNCYSLDNVDISNVSNFATYAFSGCYSLENVELPKRITKLPDYTFTKCQSLRFVWIPRNITSFGRAVFNDCRGLRCVIFESETPPSGTQAIFNNCNNSLVALVPPGCVSAYSSAAYLSDLASSGRIMEIGTIDPYSIVVEDPVS